MVRLKRTTEKLFRYGCFQSFLCAKRSLFIINSFPCARSAVHFCRFCNSVKVEQRNKAKDSLKTAKSLIWRDFRRFSKGAPNCTVSCNTVKFTKNLQKSISQREYLVVFCTVLGALLHDACNTMLKLRNNVPKDVLFFLYFDRECKK